MIFVLTICIVTLGNVVPASDVLELTNGVTISGTVLNPKEMPRKTWQIQMAEGVTVELPHRTTVVRQAFPPPALEQYYAKAPFLPESVETHLKLAEVCMSQSLVPLGNLHYQRVLEIDPDNPAARQVLGYAKIDGEWKTRDDFMLQRGYVKNSRGQWVTRQRLMIDERQVQIRQEHPASDADQTEQKTGRAAIPDLITALVTQREVVVQQSNPNLAQYTDSGNNSYVGNQALKPEKTTELVFNQDVLVELKKLSGSDFGYDIPAWQEWWSGQNTLPNFDARRGSRD